MLERDRDALYEKSKCFYCDLRLTDFEIEDGCTEEIDQEVLRQYASSLSLDLTDSHFNRAVYCMFKGLVKGCKDNHSNPEMFLQALEKHIQAHDPDLSSFLPPWEVGL